MTQPEWRTVYATDYSMLQVDTTGVYDPELTVAQETEPSGRCTCGHMPSRHRERYYACGMEGCECEFVDNEQRFEVYRFSLEQCYYTGGILSDNKYHKDSEAWFASYDTYNGRQRSHGIMDVAHSVGVTWLDMVSELCSQDPRDRARAYEAIAGYYGYENFDSYPIIETETELKERLSQ